jgi:AcrR family transcriptional regulator
MPKQFETKEKARETIVAAAGRKLRETGFSGVGVDGLMSEAGLTSGAFYTQFDSKKDLLLEVLRDGLEGVKNRFAAWSEQHGDEWLAQGLAEYLSLEHRSHVAEGCILPTLTVEAARAGSEAQTLFEQKLRELVEESSENLPEDSQLTSKQQIWATLALMAGGIMLARAVANEETADEILTACRSLAAK